MTSKITKGIRIVYEVLLGIGAIIALIYGVMFWVNSLVDSRVQSDEVIKKIANRIRPYVIFDDKEAILADMGAMSYLDSIHVETVLARPGDIPDYKITVTPKQFLSNTPILQVLESYVYAIQTTRGAGYQFIYEITTTGVSRDPHMGLNARFRLEILS